MIPQGGFTLIIHLALLAVFWVGRKLRYVGRAGIELPKGMLVAAPMVALAIVGSAATLLSTAFADRPTYSYFVGAPVPCRAETSPEPSGPVAVLRIDDIQAHVWRDIQIRMIDDALARGMPPVLGVIPVGVENDRYLVSYLRARRCEVEIALHGFDNRDSFTGEGEFAYLSKDAALSRMERGRDALAMVSADIHTFIPPENDMSEGALAALPEAGLSILSAGSGRPDDFHATTYHYDTNKLAAPAEVLRRCRERFVLNRHCVIMLHPQDFAASDGSLDPEKYARYLTVLDSLKRDGVTALRFTDLYHVR